MSPRQPCAPAAPSKLTNRIRAAQQRAAPHSPPLTLRRAGERLREAAHVRMARVRIRPAAREFQPESVGGGTMSPKKAAQKPAKGTTAIGKTSKGFTDEERAAMKERAQ